jgi:hypothetical protein
VRLAFEVELNVIGDAGGEPGASYNADLSAAQRQLWDVLG